jgi:SSS family transporter
MLSIYDHIVIVFYFVFMLGIGFVFRHFSKNDSDYFRGGASMLWWMVGATAFMTQFSAWTFTGAASKAYQDGTLVALIFFANAAGYFVNYLWTAGRFRRMRLITPIEGVRERFGPINEQVFTWLQLPLSITYAGIWLNGLGIFMTAVFGVDLQVTIWAVGLVVVLMSVSGGSWAVVASDFIQVLILMTISVVTAALALSHPAVGGLTGLIDKVPSHHFNWTEVARPQIIYFWIFATFVKQFIVLNNMQDSYRYLSVKDGHQARKAALMACILMSIGPLIWFIPPMAAAVIEPDIASRFPDLKNAAEASYILIAQETMPVGMLGLLLCGIFAATMSSMDSGLNRNAGIFVKNFYQPVLRKDASSLHLLVVGRVVSAAFGVLIILVAIFISQLEGLDLFNIMLLFSSLIAIPYAIPLVWGIIIKKTPSWSGWSTVLVGFCVSLAITGFKVNETVLVKGIDPAWFSRFFHFEGDLSPRETKDYLYFAAVLGNTVVCSAWFLFTRLFYGTSGAAYRERVDRFFADMNRPVDFKKEIGEEKDNIQALTLGRMCFVYGGFVALLALIPNPFAGRLCFMFCATCIILVGVLLVRSSRATPATGSTLIEGEA